MTPDRERAAADLAALDADRAAPADRVAPAAWFGPALGLLLFVFLSSNALDSPWVTVPALLGFGIGIGLLVNAYRVRTGVWASTPPSQLAGWAVFVVAVLSHRWTRARQRELREGV